MKILSIYPYLTISSAALLINGKIVSAVCEERFDRKKSSTDFPVNSIKWCLEKNNLKLDDLDKIVVPWNPQRNINDASLRWVNEMRWRGEMLTNVPTFLFSPRAERGSCFSGSIGASEGWSEKRYLELTSHVSNF